MKICLFSPYVPRTVGGGEKYFFDVASCLVAMGHEVFMAVSTPAGEILDGTAVREKYEQFFAIDLRAVQFIPTPLYTSAGFWQKLWWTQQWEVLYAVTDGSFFFSLAKRNIVHIQIPFTSPQNGFLNRLKLANWSIKNTNSQFTKKVIEKAWATQIPFVHYPMIEAPDFAQAKPIAKEKVILHVGRFFRQLHSKRQDVLVEIFRELVKTDPATAKGWQLVLIGSFEDPEYVAEVKKAAKGLPIHIIEANRHELWQWYRRASIYWHATGFGLDEDRDPAKMEHFGISTVEAMSQGCVPVVIGMGGQPEVVGPALRGLLWKTPAECVAHTLEVMKDVKARQQDATKAVQQAKQFSRERFMETLQRMVSE